MTVPDFSDWVCPLPLRNYDRIVLGHGGGGRLSAELIEHLFVPAFGPNVDRGLRDSAILVPPKGVLAFSTDSYVVRPLFFAGGSIGDLAVNGTINDLAMSGAQPIALSCAFILEEGLEMAVLGRVVDHIARAARVAGVRIVTGDTKVVNRGAADGMFINTAGVGVIPDGVDISPDRATPGDVVILSGDIGLHGMAVLSEREGIEFGTTASSDSAPLHDLVRTMLDANADLHVLRDPTRGGLAASLCEIAAAADVGIVVDESLLPVPDEVRAACSLLGLDPMHIANEGKLIAFVAPDEADAVLTAMHDHEHGAGARAIGSVVEDHPGMVIVRTPFGASRVVDLPMGEVLPRIC